MKTPKALEALVEGGLIDEVLSQLKSGKEATVYLVRSGGRVCCAKVYKDAKKRNFRQATLYREGRKTRNSRAARAMEKGSRFGRQEQEAHWQNVEVQALYALSAAGVRVPAPHGCFDGVLLMDTVTDEDGAPAPRLSEGVFTAEEAVELHSALIQDVVRMLCAGWIHGDLSEYNILLDPHGPVIIDLPQAVNAAANPHARSLLERDVNNLRGFFSQFAPELANSRYALEIWQHYEDGSLQPDTLLTGQAEEDLHAADLISVLQEIEAAQEEERARQERANDALQDD